MSALPPPPPYSTRPDNDDVIRRMELRIARLENELGRGGEAPAPIDDVFVSQVRVGDTLLLGPSLRPHTVVTTRVNEDRIVLCFGYRHNMRLRGNSMVKRVRRSGP